MAQDDKPVVASVDVQVIPVSANTPMVVPAPAPATVPVNSPVGNGYMVMPLNNATLVAVPPAQPQMSQPYMSSPQLVVITVGQNDEEEKKKREKEKKLSSVFQRL
jgi:hypothetical protein